MNKPIVDSLRRRFETAKILILGFGREGKSTYQLLNQVFEGQKEIVLMDQDRAAMTDYLKKTTDQATNKQAIIRDWDLSKLNQYDYIFKTPGLPGYQLAEVRRSKIYSQTQLFLEYCGKNCIGVTGTKGKSTTASLIAYLFTRFGLAVELVGNIGRPALEVLLTHQPDRYYVYEMSSFQTEFLQTAPWIGIVLNLYQEHLNNYLDYAAYQASKIQLFRGRAEYTRHMIYGCDNPVLMERIKELKSELGGNYNSFGQAANNDLNETGFYLQAGQVVEFDGTQYQKWINKDFERQLLGEHNLINLLAALVCVRIAGQRGIIDVSGDRILSAIEYSTGFKGLPHRLEEVGSYRQIRYYNDSISTIPEATTQAITAIGKVNSLIIGGFDRGIDYTEFAQYLEKAKLDQIICLPETGHKICDLAGKPSNWYKVDSMAEAVELSYQLTKAGGVCLLSPAASSYNQYRNFEERGEDYIKWIKDLA